MTRVRSSPSTSGADVVTASLAMVLPDEPLPVRLMNTIWADRFGVYDALTTTANLRAWLAAVFGDDGVAPDGRDVKQFRMLRDGLRRLAALLTDDTRPAAASATAEIQQAVADVNRAVTRAPTLPQLAYDRGGLYAIAAPGRTEVQRALSSLAYGGVELLTGEGRTVLRACNAPGCVLYFVKDHPRREWCSTACGNRARVARHYDRHRRSPS
jgi:predicted RNA-binding Zn ribbon-like protein